MFRKWMRLTHDAVLLGLESQRVMTLRLMKLSRGGRSPDRINKTGTTVLMATHDQRIVNTMRKRVIQLDRGVIVRDQARGVYE